MKIDKNHSFEIEQIKSEYVVVACKMHSEKLVWLDWFITNLSRGIQIGIQTRNF